MYDAQGQLAAEYGPATDSGTSYLTADHLGSTRLVTDGNDAPKKCYDYFPFGEEIVAGMFGRSNCFPSGVYPSNPDVLAEKFTGKERDAETGLDYFGARYDSSAQGRFLSPDPITATALHIINPQRWNMYAYAVNNPLSFVDPDGRDAIAVNFSKEVGFGPVQGGHEGIIVVDRNTGQATYARFGAEGGSRPLGEGQVDRKDLTPLTFRTDGLPTNAAYETLIEEVAAAEGQDPSSVRLNYFRTSEADTLSLKNWISAIKEASDRRKAPAYNVGSQNCAVFAICGLIQGKAITPNTKVSLIPNRLFDLLSAPADENYSNGNRSRPKEEVKPTHRNCLVDRQTGECVQ